MSTGRMLAKLLCTLGGRTSSSGLPKISAQILALSAAAALLTAAVTAAPTGAQEQSAAVGSLALLDQTDWVTGGSTFSMDLRVSTSLLPEQIDLVVTVYTALNNRSSFAQSLDGKIPGSAVILERRPLAEVLDAAGDAHIVLPVGDASQRRYFLRDNGVYPVRVELRETGTTRVIDQLTTHLINQPTPPAPTNRLGVALVLPVQVPLSNDPEHLLTVPNGLTGLTTIIEALEARGDLPLTLAASPESLERLDELEGLDGTNSTLSDRLVSAAKDIDVLRSTWAPLPSTAYRSELTREVDRQLDRGLNVLRERFESVDSSTLLATDPIDANALTYLQGRGIGRLVIPEGNLAVQRRDTTLARPFVVSPGRGKAPISAVQADSGLTRHFEGTDDAVLAAHRLLADLTVIWNDRPALQREVVIMPPSNWSPNLAFLTTLFDGLRNSPTVTSMSLANAFAVQPEGGSRAPLTRQMSTPKNDNGLDAGRIKDGREQLIGFSSMVEENNVVRNELERRLLYSESSYFDSESRDAQLDAFENKLHAQLGSIHVPPERSLQLTARTGEIPVSIQNDSGYAMKLRVELASDKLQFPEGATQEIVVDRQNITIPFTIAARTSGAFPVQVRITSVDGSIVVAQSRIIVRSTAASGLGLALSLGAGSFLVLWWARSLWKTRRGSGSKPKPHSTVAQEIPAS